MAVPVIIASGNRLLRQEIRNRLTQEGMSCVGEVNDFADIVARCQSARHIVLLDAACGEAMFGVIEQIASHTSSGVVVLGDELDANLLRRVMQAGARDFVLVRTEGQRLGQVITRVAAALSAPDAQAASSSGPGKVITVFSTKGGVGKTTIASNLAASVAWNCGLDAALVDLDLEFGGVASMFGVHPQATIVDLCRVDTAIDNSLVDKVMARAKPVGGGRGAARRTISTGQLRILAAPHSPDLAAEVDGDARRRPGHNYIADVLEAVSASVPYVVIDTGSTFRETNLTALDCADLILLVTTPDILALQNTGKCLEILLHRLEYSPERINLVMNEADMALGVSVQDISKGLDFPVAHKLPRDARTAIWAANCGQPFVLTHPQSKLAESVIRIARQLTGTDRKPERRRGAAEA